MTTADAVASITKTVNEADMQLIVSHPYGETGFCAYIRSPLELDVVPQKLREAFGVVELVERWEDLPPIAPTQGQSELAFTIPAYIDDHPNTKNLQTLFAERFATVELESITPSAEELEQIGLNRYITASKKVLAVILYMGYVESCKVSPLILYRLEGPAPDDVFEAVKQIADRYLEKYRFDIADYAEDEWNWEKRACCVATKSYTPEKQFCQDSSCDAPLLTEAFDPERFKDWLYSLPGLSNDRYGGGFEDAWWEFDGVERLFDMPKEAVIQIREQAEEYLTLCVDPNKLTGESRERLDSWIQDYRENYCPVRFKDVNIEEATVEYIIRKEIKRLSEEKLM